MNLKNELKKWTTAVAAIATSIEKNKHITGNKIVPRPKPEKKVNVLPIKTVNRIINNSN
jgi:hypothetical protein